MRRLSFEVVKGRNYLLSEGEEENNEEEGEGKAGYHFLPGRASSADSHSSYSSFSGNRRKNNNNNSNNFRRSSSSAILSLSSALSCVSSRKSFSYDKLAQVPIQLFVRKLDGSSFDINVTKMATIAELKQAVECVFSHLPTKGPGKVSWRHVWGHFCLSYCGRKLLKDNECIKDYGIKDGDELHFVRHVSIVYNLIKKHSRKQLEAPKPCTISESHEDAMPAVDDDYDDLENLKCQQYIFETVQYGAPTTRRHKSNKMGRWFRWLL